VIATHAEDGDLKAGAAHGTLWDLKAGRGRTAVLALEVWDDGVGLRSHGGVGLS
jgi:hypothetical protein